MAVWDSIATNPWAALPAAELRERGLAPPPPDGPPPPGPFALGSREVVGDLLEDVGFTEIAIEAVDVSRRHSSFEEMWEATLDLSYAFHDAVLARPQPEIDEIKTSLARRFAPYTAADGSLEVPGRALLAAATA